jgi:digeranylgeranylglycerophospholipid reductase
LNDVIVIGGGPAGSHTACRLAAAGHRVAVVEQKKRLGGPVCCTGILGRECIESFAIDDDVILRWVNSASLFSPSGRSVRMQRKEPFAAIVDRAAFDLALARRAQEKGVEYILGSPVIDVEAGDDRVKVKACRRGQEVTLEARAAVIAAGFNPGLLGRLGLGRFSDFVMGAQAEVDTSLSEVEVYFNQEIDPGFFAWVAPTSSRKALVGLALRRNSGLYFRKLIPWLFARGKIASGEATPRFRAIPIKPLARTYGHRLIVVGDAAGQVKPTTGGGIYYGLLCADIAADTLHRALNDDDLSARRLADYQRRWRRKLGKELRIDYYARRFYERMSDRQIDRAFDLIKSHRVDEALLQVDSFFDWHARAVLKLLGHRAVSMVASSMKGF